MIHTFNDFLEADALGRREAFIIEAIDNYKLSDEFLNALESQEYYARRNTAILNRMSYLERTTRLSINSTFHRLASGFYPKFIKQISSYLTGNGVTLPDTEKSKLKNIDKKIKIATTFAMLDGVTYGYYNKVTGETKLIRAADNEGYNGFFMLPDERTGENMVGIRFWQMEDQRPMYVELYELAGKTEYIQDGNELQIIIPLEGYENINRRDAFGEQTSILPSDKLPIIPYYGNELHQSEIIGTKGWIDAYDFVASDLVDEELYESGLYALVRNYNGADIEGLFADIRAKKALIAEGGSVEGAVSADLKAIEIPHQAKAAILEFISKRLYEDFMVPSAQEGRGVTATEIKQTREPIDLKADEIEVNAVAFVNGLLEIAGVVDAVPTFKRRTSGNDTEAIDNISTQLSGEWIDIEEAIELDPTIPDERKADLLERLETKMLGQADETFPLQQQQTETQSE